MVEFVVRVQVFELEAVDDAAAVPEQQVREDEDEHPVRLLAPAELDDRVPAGGRAVGCCAAAATGFDGIPAAPVEARPSVSPRDPG